MVAAPCPSLEDLRAFNLGKVTPETVEEISEHLESCPTCQSALVALSESDDPRATARFEREMEAIGRVDHPHVVRATDAREVDGRRFLVMEYVEGLNLTELVQRCGPLPVADACELVRQAALGLQCAHEHGLVHRDIKPSNLMLNSHGQLNILDLGLALLQGDPANDVEMTSSGQAMGTADYMAPEQASDSHNVDIRADIYSLGCTLFKLLTGHAPFSALTAAKKLEHEEELHLQFKNKK